MRHVYTTYAEAIAGEFREPAPPSGPFDGGYIVQHLPIDHTELVRFLILVATACPAVSVRPRGAAPPAGCNGLGGPHGNSATTPWPSPRSGYTRPSSSTGVGPWRTTEEAELATLEWVHWFNHKRLHSAIGDIPPIELGGRAPRQREIAPRVLTGRVSMKPGAIHLAQYHFSKLLGRPHTR